MWAWLRWRLGEPTLDQVARHARGVVEAKGGTEVAVDLALGELRFKIDGAVHTIGLGNVYQDVLRAPRALRRAVIERFVGAVLLPADHQVPDDYAQARARLLPIVRTVADDAIGMLSMRRMSTPAAPAIGSGMAARPIAGDLIAGLAYDTPDAMQRIPMDKLQAWGVSLDQALEDAAQNLRALPEHGAWQDLGGGLWSGEWRDSYESSRLLLPDLIHRLGVPEPVALVPLRHTLLVASARNEGALAAMAATAKRLLGEQPRWLSVQPVVLTDEGWQVFEPPAAARDAFDELRCLETASTYASQQPLLHALNERDEIDVYVAKVSLAQGKGDGKLTTYAVWSEGVDTLLPKTRIVVLHRPDDTESGSNLMVPWDEMWAVAGHLLTPTDDRPVRYLARRFPDEGQWGQLRASVARTSGAA